MTTWSHWAWERKHAHRCAQGETGHWNEIQWQELRKYALKDKPLCDICARAKNTRVPFNKLHKIRDKNIGVFISCYIAVFKNWVEERIPIRVGIHGSRNEVVLGIPDEAKNEFPTHFDDLVNMKLRARRASIKHYHADWGAELIGKSIVDTLKKMGATYSWNPANTPELNATNERRFRTLSKRCLSMLLQSGFSVDFWWDCYKAISHHLRGCTSNRRTYRIFEYGGVNPTYEFLEPTTAKTGETKCTQSI